MNPDKVIILHFEIDSLSYQAFSEIKKLHVEKQLIGEQMAIVTHSNDGNHQFTVKEFIDFTGKNNTNKDGLIGMMIGVLGGPLGVLLGWFTGSMVGSAKDIKDIQTANSIFNHLISSISDGETGVILIAKEDDNRPLNELIFNQLKGNITRLDLNDVKKEIQDAQDIEKNTKEHAQTHWKKRYTEQS